MSKGLIAYPSLLELCKQQSEEKKVKLHNSYFAYQKAITVRSAVSELSLSDGQGVIKCNCTGDCKQMRCGCRSAGLACNSKCHGKQFTSSNDKDLTEQQLEEEINEQEVMEEALSSQPKAKANTQSKKEKRPNL